MGRVLNGEILRRELFGEGKRESDDGVAGVEKGMSGLKGNEDNWWKGVRMKVKELSQIVKHGGTVIVESSLVG
jgi:hypothetical protein